MCWTHTQIIIKKNTHRQSTTHQRPVNLGGRELAEKDTTHNCFFFQLTWFFFYTAQISSTQHIHDENALVRSLHTGAVKPKPLQSHRRSTLVDKPKRFKLFKLIQPSDWILLTDTYSSNSTWLIQTVQIEKLGSVFLVYLTGPTEGTNPVLPFFPIRQHWWEAH